MCDANTAPCAATTPQGGFIWDWVDQGLDKMFTKADGTPVKGWAYGGDFDEEAHDAQFCINGMVFPDRTPHPACWEAKAAMVRGCAVFFSARFNAHAPHTNAHPSPQSPQAPLEFTLANGGKGALSVKIDNTNSFASTDGLTFSWRVVLNGAPLDLGSAGVEGWRDVAVSPIAAQVSHGSVFFCVARCSAAALSPRTHLPTCPQASSTVSLGVKGADVTSAAKKALASVATSRPSELFLEVRAVIGAATAWCDAVSVAERLGRVCGETRRKWRRCGDVLWLGARAPTKTPPPTTPSGSRRCRRPAPAPR